MAEPTAVVEPVAVESTDEAQQVVTDDVLVEEVSIDGMCGVY